MTNRLTEFLNASYTAYQATENARQLLLENGFLPLSETEDWALEENGKYFVERNGSSLVAFTVGALDDFSFKIVASHTDSPALKLKENAVSLTGAYAKLNAETYGGGIWYSFFDRPLKIAGRVVVNEGGILKSENVASEYFVTVPSLAVHMNRGVNEGFSVNAQTDLQPLFALSENGETPDFLSGITEKEVVSYDLYLVNADMPYVFGRNGEFLASPRIDNLTSVCSSLEALTAHGESGGVCVAACLDNEEVGSQTLQGAGGDFLENVLRRIAYALKFDDNEYYKALAASFLISLDNAHAMHPNHPEKCDPTNKTTMGGGVVVKSHANKAYTTDALSSAVIKTIFKKAGVKYQTFFNRSDMRSGGTLGAISLSHAGILSADLGLAQLAMHSASECFAKADYEELLNGLTAYYSSNILFGENGVEIL
ncbi:MAG: M18 family aminopeptidase [Firmicutes bacterium]|jgi:M18 family aminopeptidase|nr:M18 family aminopeptidase [Clostridia bacterium]MBS5022711.1 M18 family aminopeptidase [Bacillota bacterium]